MAQLRTYNSQVLPGVTPAVNYYDGKDFYNIANAASKLRSAGDDLAYNKAMAMTERFVAEEETAKTSNPSSYNGDPDKYRDAKLAEIKAKAGTGDQQAIRDLQSFGQSGIVPGIPDYHYSSYEDRMNTREAEIIEETGLSGKQLEQYKINVYRMNTAMNEKNKVDRDVQMDIEVVNEQKGIFFDFIDAGETDQAVRVADSLFASDRITQDVQEQMKTVAWTQEDGDRITAEADAFYQLNPNLNDLDAHIAQLVDNDELWDGKGMGVKADRQAYMAEYRKVLDAKNGARIDAANQTVIDNLRVASDAFNDYRNGKISLEDLNRTRYEMEDLQTAQANPDIQEVDKLNDTSMQKIIDWLYQDPKTPTADDQKDEDAYIMMILDDRATELKATGTMSDTQIVASLMDEEIIYQGKKVSPRASVVVENFYQKRAPLVDQARQESFTLMKQMIENGSTVQDASNAQVNFMKYIETNQDYVTPGMIEEAKQNWINGEAQKIMTGETPDNIEHKWYQGNSKTNNNWNKQQVGFETMVGQPSPTNISNGANNMLFLQENAMQKIDGEWQTPELHTDAFKDSDGYNDFLNAKDIYNGFSLDAYDKGAKMIVPVPDSGVVSVDLGGGYSGSMREVSIAQRDKYTDEGVLGVDTGQEKGQKVYIVERFDGDGNVLPSVFYTESQVLSGNIQGVKPLNIRIPHSDLGDKIRTDAYPIGGGAITDDLMDSINKDLMLYEDDPKKLDRALLKYNLGLKPNSSLSISIPDDFFDNAAEETPVPGWEDYLDQAAITPNSGRGSVIGSTRERTGAPSMSTGRRGVRR